MSDAPIRVEVYSQETEAVNEADGGWTFWGAAPKGSLTEAMMRLAEAYVHERDVDRAGRMASKMGFDVTALAAQREVAIQRLSAALARVRELKR